MPHKKIIPALIISLFLVSCYSKPIQIDTAIKDRTRDSLIFVREADSLFKLVKEGKLEAGKTYNTGNNKIFILY